MDNPPILQKSLELARALYPSAFQELRTFHVSVLWNKNRLLSVGVNKNKTHSRNLRNKKHNREGINISNEKLYCSELACLFSLGKQRYTLDFSKCVLVNIRMDRNGRVALSRPCESCGNLLKYTSPRRVYFTNNEGKFEQYHI